MDVATEKNAQHHTRCLPQFVSGITELKPEDPFLQASSLMTSCTKADNFAAEQYEYFDNVVAMRKELKKQNDERRRRMQILKHQRKMLKEYLRGKKKITAELDIGAVLDKLTENEMGPQILRFFNGRLYSSSGELYSSEHLVYGENGQVFTLAGELIGRVSLTYHGDPNVMPTDYKYISIGQDGVVCGQDGQPYNVKDLTFGLDGLVHAHLDNQIIGRYIITYQPDGMGYSPFGDPVGYKRVKYSPDGTVYSHDGYPNDPKNVTYGLDEVVYGPNEKILGGYTLTYGADGMAYSPTGDALGYRPVRYGQYGMIYGHDGQPYYPREVTYGLNGMVYGPNEDILGSYKMTHESDGTVYGPNGEFVGYKAVQYGPGGSIYGIDGVIYDANEVQFGEDGLVYAPDGKIIGSYEIAYGSDGMGYDPTGKAIGYKRVKYRSEGSVVGHNGLIYDVGELNFARNGLVYGPNEYIIGSFRNKEEVTRLCTTASSSHDHKKQLVKDGENGDAIKILEEVAVSQMSSITLSSGLLEPEDISPRESDVYKEGKTVEVESVPSLESTVPDLISLQRKETSDASLYKPGTSSGVKSGKGKTELKRMFLLYRMGKAFFSLRQKELRAQNALYGTSATYLGSEVKIPVGPVLLPDGRLAVGHPQLGLIGANTITGLRENEDTDVNDSLADIECQTFYDHELYTRCDAESYPINYNILHIPRMEVVDFRFRRSVSSYESEYNRKLSDSAPNTP